MKISGYKVIKFIIFISLIYGLILLNIKMYSSDEFRDDLEHKILFPIIDLFSLIGLYAISIMLGIHKDLKKIFKYPLLLLGYLHKLLKKEYKF